MSPPRQRAPTPPPAPLPPAITGIRRLDHALVGSPARPHLVLLHDAAIDASAFLLHAATHAGAVVYATTSRAPDAQEQERARLGVGADARITWVDLREVREPKQALERLEDAGTKDATLAIDSLTGFMHAWGEAAAREWFLDVRRTWTGPLLACVADRAYEPATHEAWLAADAVVRLVRRDVRGTRLDAFQVQRGTAMPHFAVPYRLERPGGVQPQLSKIIVTGAYSAGKSTFVHTISEAGVNVEHLGTTVSMDHGRVDRDGLTVHVFGTPGQERFDPIIRQAGHGALGVIAVVDSTRPSTLHRARTLADELSGGQVPVVYAANKQDAPGALPAQEIRTRLGIGADVPVLACQALDRASALAVLDTLIDRVLAGLAVGAAAKAG